MAREPAKPADRKPPNGAEELLARYRSGERNFAGANLRRAELPGAVLLCVDLSDSILVGANLAGARLTGSNLDGASLEDINLTGARLKATTMRKARMKAARLRGADLGAVDVGYDEQETGELARSGLRPGPADLEGADLRHVDLSGCDLTLVNLENCNLRHVAGLRLETTRTRNARFDANASDPWSVLRRNYTGANFAFRLLLLLAFVLPYVARTMFWIGINKGQVALIEFASKVEEDRIPTATEGSPLLKGWEQRRDIEARVALNYRKWSVWQILLGFDKGWTYWSLSLALLIYYVARGLLTWRVGPLRDEEERSGYSPAWKEYRWLYELHRVASVLFFLAVAALLWHGFHWLSAPVWLPA